MRVIHEGNRLTLGAVTFRKACDCASGAILGDVTLDAVRQAESIIFTAASTPGPVCQNCRKPWLFEALEQRILDPHALDVPEVP